MAQEIVTNGSGEGLTEQQERLVEALSAEGPLPDAMILCNIAGYDTSSHLGAVTRSEAVQRALHTRRVARIKGQVAAKALKAIETLIESDTTPAATRLAASKWVLEQAGHTDAQEDGKSKAPAEMSVAELEAFIKKLEGEMKPAKVVAPDNGA